MYRPAKQGLITVLMLTVLALSTSCTKQSVVFSSPYFHPISAQGPLSSYDRVGLIISPSMDAEIARSVTQEEFLRYDFEFRVGEDVRKTLPKYLSSFMDVVLIKNINEGRGFDFILDPKVTSSLVLYIGFSAAPRYDIAITLDVSAIKDGAIQERFFVKNNSHVEISAFKNMDEERTETMRLRYEEQLTAIYNELERQLRKFLELKTR